MPFDPTILKPGDCLLYGPRGVVGWLIAMKTWHRIAHVEVFEGVIDGVPMSVASRDGIGCNRYVLRTSELVRVLRPNQPVDLAAATAWFERVARGQRYDFRAILRFLWPSDSPDADPNRQICSAFSTRWYRAGGLRVFSAGEDADRIAPFQFDTSPALDEVWRA